MFIELHMLQNFAPSNLNRDDTGAPKDCEFGGYRRARISSQCLKRAARLDFSRDRLLSPEDLAIRTRLLVDEELVPRLERAGKNPDDAHNVVEALLSSVGIAMDSGGETTQYLLFLAKREIDKLEQLALSHWDTLLQAAAAGGKDKKTKKEAAKELKKDVESALDGGKAADLALFGRMLADLPTRNVDAASQWAHAISTHPVEMKSDYFTAVDDLQDALRRRGEEDADAGAGMLGTVEFNSACYYRYANVDADQLLKNLQGDKQLALQTLRAFLAASVRAVPTGKQNSMAAYNPPSLVLAVLRDSGPQNLANAFALPADARRPGGLLAASVQKLGDYRQKLSVMYGSDGEHGAWFASTEDGPDSLGQRVPSVAQVIDQAVGTVRFGAA